MNEILFLSAPLKERIWGGDYFKNVLKVTSSDEKIGEMWTLSAIQNDESIILNDTYKGLTLKELFLNHKELFLHTNEKEFPILIKLIDTKDKLSVQVHPNDHYAKKYENSFGKTEAWLILDSKKESKIVAGSLIDSKEELENKIKEDKVEEVLNYINVSKGEFYPIESGTIHALGENILLLEIQQSSDITYRFYDYHRKDKNGNKRELHVKKALDVVSLKPYLKNPINAFSQDDIELWNNEYFNVNKYKINKERTFIKDDSFLVISLIEGNLNINNHELILGESFIATSLAKEFTLKGNGSIVITKYLK